MTNSTSIGKLKKSSSKTASKEKPEKELNSLGEIASMSMVSKELKYNPDDEVYSDSESQKYKKQKVFKLQEDDIEQNLSHNTSSSSSTAKNQSMIVMATTSNSSTSTSSVGNFGPTKVIGHSKASSQYVSHFNPPMTPTKDSDNLVETSKMTSPLNSSGASIRNMINNRLDNIFGMLDALPNEKEAKEKAYLEINTTVISMSNDITRYKKNLSEGKATKLHAAVTSMEKTADVVLEDQGFLHLFNVEHKSYECAVNKEQSAQARLKHATSELNVTEAKMVYILKLLREKKLTITLKDKISK